ncbi:hypothetical protein UFOVP570_27 [uncultured Caudovirales phage]|jgi:hypothetical protein|uniref:Uncharacterized protein n=1 Tax=uncultured Caudovirales phage TaxID=2100421 RepID=A0A6J5MZC4_9CAUD|nr:hypothetical protein UFOVP570_27 [uncultured Caudovirales phage]
MFNFWNLCPVGGKRHGYLIVTRNEAGGLLAHCEKCYKPRKKRARN